MSKDGLFLNSYEKRLFLITRLVSVGIAAGYALVSNEIEGFVTAGYIGRGQGNFTAAAGCIQGKGWYCHARKVTYQMLHDIKSGFNAGAKMGGSPGKIRLEKIVGFYPDGKELTHKPVDGVRVVVDSLEQHGLTAKRNTCIGKARAG